MSVANLDWIVLDIISKTLLILLSLGGCVNPSLPCTASPLRPLPIVQTALARNLTGPLPLSTLQGRAKHG